MPPRITKSPLRAVAGVLLHGIGLLVLTAGLLSGLGTANVFFGLGRVVQASGLESAVLLLVALACGGLIGVAIGSRLRVLGRRIYQPAAREVLEQGKEFILFLRSFELDDYRYSTIDVPEWFSRLGVRAEIALTWFYERGIAEPAEAPIVAAFNNFYPVIAVGRPGELLPALGAARLYLSDAEWQARVADLISRARLILLAVGKTPGLDWEISTIVRAGALSKLAVYVPVDRGQRQVLDKNWRAFRAEISRLTDIRSEKLPPQFGTEVVLLIAPGTGEDPVVFRPDYARPPLRGPSILAEGAHSPRKPSLRARRREMARAVLVHAAHTEGATGAPRTETASSSRLDQTAATDPRQPTARGRATALWARVVGPRVTLFALSLAVLIAFEWRDARARARREATTAIRRATAANQLRIGDSCARANKLEQALGAYVRAYETDTSVDLKSRGLEVVSVANSQRRLQLVHPATLLTNGNPKIPIRHRIVGIDTSRVRYTVLANGSVDTGSIEFLRATPSTPTDGIVTYIRSLKYEPARLAGTAVDQRIARELYFWTN